MTEGTCPCLVSGTFLRGSLEVSRCLLIIICTFEWRSDKTRKPSTSHPYGPYIRGTGPEHRTTVYDDVALVRLDAGTAGPADPGLPVGTGDPENRGTQSITDGTRPSWQPRGRLAPRLVLSPRSGPVRRGC